jgi:hypothetical protein
VHEADPTGENEPGGHLVQVYEPFSENAPAGQFEQVTELASENLPAGQSVQKILPLRAKVPFGHISHPVASFL